MLVGLDLTDCTNIMTEKQIFIWNKNYLKSAHSESFYKLIAETRMQTHGRHIEKALWERLAISSCLSAQWDRSSKTGCVNPGPVQTNSKLIQGCQRANTNEWVDIKPAKRPQLDLSFIFLKHKITGLNWHFNKWHDVCVDNCVFDGAILTGRT